MNSKQENGEERAKKTMEKMENPKMRNLMNEFVSEFDVRIPPEYELLFLKSWESFTKKLGPFNEIKSRSSYSQPELFFNQINDQVHEKFCAVNYHLTNAKYLQKLVDEYTNRVLGVAEEIGIDWQITVGITLRKLHIEYEAFILQCRACLDHFVVSISYYFGFYTMKIEALKRKLEELSLRDKKAQKILNLMGKNRKFYDIIKSKTKAHPSNLSDRDKIAHYGKVLLRPLNIMINPVSGTRILPLARHQKEGEMYGDSFNLPSLIEFMESVMRDLFSFISEIYEVIFTD